MWARMWEVPARGGCWGDGLRHLAFDRTLSIGHNRRQRLRAAQAASPLTGTVTRP